MKTAVDPGLRTLAALIAGRAHHGEVNVDAWEKIIPAALRHGVGPMLYSKLKTAGLKLPAKEMGEALHSSYLRSAAVYMALERAALKVEAAFRTNDIETIWLKGIALAHQVYPDPALRPMVDLDVWVPYEKKESALNAAEAAGFWTYEDPRRMFGTGDEMGTSHHYHLREKTNEIAILEIHFELLIQSEKLLPREKYYLFWEQTEALKIVDTEFNILKPEINLLHLCAHAALQHGEAEFDLLRYFDMHQVITHKLIDWERLVEIAKEIGWTYFVERSFRVCKGYFETHIPEEAMRRLAEEIGERAVRRRARLLQKPVREWEGLLGQLGELPSRKRWRMIISLVFPGLEYMRQRYAVSRTWQIWFYYPYRWADMSLKLGRVWWARWKSRVVE